jgi:hypothetical protein
LPDGYIFSNQNFGNFWKAWDWNILIYLISFITIWYTYIWRFALLYGILVYFVSFVIFPQFWYICIKKNLATLSSSTDAEKSIFTVQALLPQSEIYSSIWQIGSSFEVLFGFK